MQRECLASAHPGARDEYQNIAIPRPVGTQQEFRHVGRADVEGLFRGYTGRNLRCGAHCSALKEARRASK